jgi:dTDP-4-amino-4,6-dideoxygalactose transaminase
MPVAPFGRPIDLAAWDRFRSRTGTAVVIDAATAFDAIVPSAAPSVVSLHATKVLGVGEGGFVMSTDAAIVRDIRARANFGFAGTREAVAPSGNAKLSEYHAAVGHAALDEWAEVRPEWMALAKTYRAALRESNELRFQDGFGDSWITSTCVARLTDSRLAHIESALARAGVETRRWWGDGAHAHPATAAFPRTRLPATASLAQSTLALPLFRGLSAEQIWRIAQTIRDAAGA